MMRLQEALGRVARDLDAIGHPWALIGGMAVLVRAEPRTTNDIDVVVAVAGDGGVARAIAELVELGYRIDEPARQGDPGSRTRVAMWLPGERTRGTRVDLLFAASGIEAEVANAADRLEIAPGLTVPVATVGHLLALKVLAGRPLDLYDASRLLAVSGAEDCKEAQESLQLISERGFGRGEDGAERDLHNELAALTPKEDWPEGHLNSLAL